MGKKYTAEQYLTKFEDRREIQNLAARYVAGFLFKTGSAYHFEREMLF